MVGNEKLSRSDAELAHLAAESDAAAFDAIYSRYRTLVYSLAVLMTGNLADAQYLTQGSFVSVLRRIGSFRGEASFDTWLYRVVVNQGRCIFVVASPDRKTNREMVNFPSIPTAPRSLCSYAFTRREWSRIFLDLLQTAEGHVAVRPALFGMWCEIEGG